jgi:hypothetical protein
MQSKSEIKRLKVQLGEKGLKDYLDRQKSKRKIKPKKPNAKV